MVAVNFNITEYPFTAYLNRSVAVGLNVYHQIIIKLIQTVDLFDTSRQMLGIGSAHIPHKRIVTVCVLQQIFQIVQIILKKAKSVKQSVFLFVSINTNLIHYYSRTVNIIPSDQIVLVAELTVKCSRRIPAVIGNILNRDFVDRLAFGNLTE